MNNNITYDESQIRRDVCTALVKEILKDEAGQTILVETERKVSDLTITDLYELIPKIERECKRQDAEQAEIEYRKLAGTKVPQEF